MDFKGATELFADPDFDGEPVVIYEPRPDDPVVPPRPPILRDSEPAPPPYDPHPPGGEDTPPEEIPVAVKGASNT
jgi:type I restriction enzyme R subunit